MNIQIKQNGPSPQDGEVLINGEQFPATMVTIKMTATAVAETTITTERAMIDISTTNGLVVVRLPNGYELIAIDPACFSSGMITAQARAMDRFREETTLDEVRSIVFNWVMKQGHDKCHYQPDLFERLVKVLGIDGPPQKLVPEDEFAAGCIRYRHELYHPKVDGDVPQQSSEPA